ncbi:MAG: hypothetical protein JW821_13365 [Deltaproteobacteria bacterium]|nr:hypothetical protein [Deltaproteobacteria bacterium]
MYGKGVVMASDRVKNWYREGEGYIFTFAKGREAIGVRVDLKGGDIREDEEDRLHEVSDQIIIKGLDVLGIGPLEIIAISVEDYGSDKYTHPADEIVKRTKEMETVREQLKDKSTPDKDKVH